MDIKLEVTINGLQPLVDAINLLAKGYGASIAAVDQVVSKAKAKPAAKPEPEPVTAQAEAVDMGKPASIATEPDSSTETPTSDSALTAAEEVAVVGKSVDTQPAKTDQETPATKAEGTVNTSDEALRAAAASKARINKERTKEIVNKFANSVTAIPVEQREAFLNELATVAA